MNWLGIILGAAAFILIGAFHPIVIKAEYYIGKKCWWVFACLGVICAIVSLLIDNIVISSIIGVLAFCFFWSILELFEQEKRVKKGWFPANPKKKGVLMVVALLVCAVSSAREYKVCGPQGGLAMNITLPEGFDQSADKCPMVILMHGIFSSKDFQPMPQIAKSLARQGIASIRFDFGGHWRSEGKMINMTIAKELEDARAIYDYVASLPYVSSIAILGHSQGGVIASMTAGILASEGKSPAALVLLAPGTVIKEACQGGHFFGNTFAPEDPPEYIKCFGTFKLGREYLVSTQELEIYETAEAYQGPVCIIHGDNDQTVPLWCSEKFVQIYNDNEFHLMAGENHRLSKKTKEDVGIVTSFLLSKQVD